MITQSYDIYVATSIDNTDAYVANKISGELEIDLDNWLATAEAKEHGFYESDTDLDELRFAMAEKMQRKSQNINSARAFKITVSVKVEELHK